MDERNLGLLIAGIGFIAVLIGLGVATGLLGWFGRLPGDIRFESGNARIYVPIISMLLVSIVLSVVLALLRRFF
jgi:hypothetical protein